MKSMFPATPSVAADLTRAVERAVTPRAFRAKVRIAHEAAAREQIALALLQRPFVESIGVSYEDGILIANIQSATTEALDVHLDEIRMLPGVFKTRTALVLRVCDTE